MYTNHLLIAMPQMTDQIFGKSVIYICEHDSKGAMGIIVNKPLPSESVQGILTETGLDETDSFPKIYFGGPVGMNHGFILHDTKYHIDGTHNISKKIALTSNLDIIHDMVDGKGPNKYRFALGYAGWSAKQIESEIENGDWLVVPATPSFIFDTPDDHKWDTAAKEFGIDMSTITGSTGIA